ncbi:cytochrome c maturation protein CcmE [Rhizorhabdus dicambivorans]|uniref:Cytochrome c-type biogenesis protein CcmE n=1 Tax=Rhizorhabdus dicambivorans TaxID=1850238 RepID=A0A2A4FYS8_9SPHN|nr:cytochrome c maturation protein CcmE [Rhizorhabdus dicambivorans]ATE66572.1 cytochrome c maturation protein CcmE [Rhizorhabdus dicambivorans]PCE43944.1 cytochrome c maturation protein CcmE [Rhizorhabdus dicambivorans]
MALKAKNQRLILALLALAAIVGAALLAMSALKDQAAYFYTPSDAKKDHVETGRAVRLGGMVQKGSIERLPDGVTINFIVTDNAETVPVTFKGIVPDLFKEDSGVVAEGSFQPDGRFVATNILAKHDERYMPPQVAGQMHKTESLDK